jgi:hypothetical protein
MNWSLIYTSILLCVIILLITVSLSRILYAKVIDGDIEKTNFVFDGKSNKVKMYNCILLGSIIFLIIIIILLFIRSHKNIQVKPYLDI